MFEKKKKIPSNVVFFFLSFFFKFTITKRTNTQKMFFIFILILAFAYYGICMLDKRTMSTTSTTRTRICKAEPEYMGYRKPVTNTSSHSHWDPQGTKKIIQPFQVQGNIVDLQVWFPARDFDDFESLETTTDHDDGNPFREDLKDVTKATPRLRIDLLEQKPNGQYRSLLVQPLTIHQNLHSDTLHSFAPFLRSVRSLAPGSIVVLRRDYGDSTQAFPNLITVKTSC